MKCSLKLSSLLGGGRLGVAYCVGGESEVGVSVHNFVCSSGRAVVVNRLFFCDYGVLLFCGWCADCLISLSWVGCIKWQMRKLLKALFSEGLLTIACVNDWFYLMINSLEL